MAEFYTIAEILNSVYSGTTLNGFNTAADVLNAVYDGTSALKISVSGGGSTLADIKEVSTSTYTVLDSDDGKILEITTGCTITAGTATTNIQFTIVNKSESTVTLSGFETKDDNTLLESKYTTASVYVDDSGDYIAIGDITSA